VIRLKTRSSPLVVHGSPRPDGEWRVISEDGGGLAMEQWQDGQLNARLAG
jgi:rubredoxin-NAD+ reductase